MANSFSYSVLSQRGINCAYSGSVTVNKDVIVSAVAPSTSVSDGMVIDLSTYLPSICVGGVCMGRTAMGDQDLDVVFDPSALFTTASPAMVVRRRSTGNLVSAGVDLTGNSWTFAFQGS